MADVVILSAARTPIGRFGGAFRTMHPAELGAVAVRSALARAGLSDSSRQSPPAVPAAQSPSRPVAQIDDLIFGQAGRPARARIRRGRSYGGPACPTRCPRAR